LKRAIQILAYDDDVCIVGENIDATQKNPKYVLDANKEVGLEVNPQNINTYVTITLSKCRTKV
jgi:hypothetical protein